MAGKNDMRIFQEEIFGPTLGVTSFRTRPKHWPSPTILTMAWVPASGPAT